MRKDRPRRTVPRSFRANDTLFQREGESRFPIRRLFGPSVPQILSVQETEDDIAERTQEVALNTLENQLRFRVEKLLGSA